MSRAPVLKTEAAKSNSDTETSTTAPDTSELMTRTRHIDGRDQDKSGPVAHDEEKDRPRTIEMAADLRVPGTLGAQTHVVQVKYLPHHFGFPPIERKSAHASGVDLIAAIDKPITLGTLGDRAMVPTGVCVAIPPGYEGQVRPRSGLAAKNGITVLNTPGTIDADYRGEIVVIVLNTSTRKFVIEPGMRIAQLVFAPVTMFELQTVEELPSTERGEGGFGSTGV
jgi:dUTP pyrophosphatase